MDQSQVNQIPALELALARLHCFFFAPETLSWEKDPQVSGFHTPVLPEQVVASFAPALDPQADLAQEPPKGNISTPGQTFVDLTCGGGGHSALILERFRPSLHLVVDRDQDALQHARPRLEALAAQHGIQIAFEHARFSELASILDRLSQQDPRWASPQAIFADIGVSSHQLDEGSRGFSFRQEAPLDMRMDASRGETAAALVARCDAPQLAQILKDLGQEPDAFRIAKAIVAQKPTTTTQLAELVTEAMSAVGRRKLGKRVHPATRTFQALRIAVNQELDELNALLEQGPERLAVGGRLGIITFHSLEDRAVKRCFRDLCRVKLPPSNLPIPDKDLPKPRFSLPPVYGRGVDAQTDELQANPRARSARLRVIQRLQA